MSFQRYFWFIDLSN